MKDEYHLYNSREDSVDEEDEEEDDDILSQLGL